MSKYRLLDKVVIDESEEVLTVVEINPLQHTSGYVSASYGVPVIYSGTTFDEPKRIENSYKLIDSQEQSWVKNESDITYISTPKKLVKYDLLKMFVLVKDTAPIGLGINAVGHTTFLACRKFDSCIFKDWEAKSFRKVTCLVSPEEFDLAIEEIKKINGNYVIFNENDWNDQDISVAFEPRYTFPDIFKTFKLHGGIKK